MCATFIRMEMVSRCGLVEAGLLIQSVKISRTQGSEMKYFPSNRKWQKHVSTANEMSEFTDR